MTDNYQPKATISISYIYLKLKGSQDNRSKRIPFPRKFENLLKTAKSFFDGVIEVNSIFDENGNQIQSIDQVVPGCTVYASSLNPDDYDEIAVKKPPQSPMKSQKTVMAQNSFNRLFGNSNVDEIQPPEENDYKDVNLYDENEIDNEQIDDQYRTRKKFVSPSLKKAKKAEKEATKKGNKAKKGVNSVSETESTTMNSNKTGKLQKKPAAQMAKTYQPKDFDDDVDYDEDEIVSQTSQIVEPKKPKRKLSSKPSALPEPEKSPSPAKNTLKFPSPRAKSTPNNNNSTPRTPKSSPAASRNSNADYMQDVNNTQDNVEYQYEDYINQNDNNSNYNYEENLQNTYSRGQQDKQSNASNRSGSVRARKDYPTQQDNQSNASMRSGSIRLKRDSSVPQDDQSNASNRSGSVKGQRDFSFQQDWQSNASNKSGPIRSKRDYQFPQDDQSNASNRSGSIRAKKDSSVPQDNQSNASNRSGSIRAKKDSSVPQDDQSNASNRSGSVKGQRDFSFPQDRQSNASNRSGPIRSKRDYQFPQDDQSNASNRSNTIRSKRDYQFPQDDQSNARNRSGSIRANRDFSIPRDNQSNASNRSNSMRTTENTLSTPKSSQKRSQIPRPTNKSPVLNEAQTPTPQAQSNAQPVEKQKAMTLVVNPNRGLSSEQSSNAPSVLSMSAASDRNSQALDDDIGVEEGNEYLQNVIDETVEPGALQNVLDESLELLPECSSALQKLPELERQQKVYWYKQGLKIAESQNLPPIPEKAFGVEEMVSKARSLLTEHRFPRKSGVSYRLNFGIIGPQGSGKSVFLRVFIEELLADLASNDEWKDTFIFMLDLCNIVTYATNHLQFYKAIVAMTMQSVMWVCPTLIPHIVMIQKMFDDVTNYTSPPKFGTAFSLDPETQRIAAELQIIINKLSIIWNDEECLTEWINSIVYLPMLVSKALGFKKCIYILDHYDFADTFFSPTNTKFADSPNQINLIDIYNFALVHCNFIISCSSQHDFLNLIEQVPEEEQLKPQFQLVSTIGLIKEDTYEDKQITIGFSDDTFPTSFTCAICGGIPMLQHLWNEINQCLDILESNNQEEEEIMEELRDNLNVQVQSAMKLFFTDEDGQQRVHEVVSVRRKTIQDKNKTNDNNKANDDNDTYNEADDDNY